MVWCMDLIISSMVQIFLSVCATCSFGLANDFVRWRDLRAVFCSLISSDASDLLFPFNHPKSFYPIHLKYICDCLTIFVFTLLLL